MCIMKAMDSYSFDGYIKRSVRSSFSEVKIQNPENCLNEPHVNARLYDESDLRLLEINSRLEFCKNYFTYRVTHISNSVHSEILEIELNPTFQKQT